MGFGIFVLFMCIIFFFASLVALILSVILLFDDEDNTGVMAILFLFISIVTGIVGFCGIDFYGYNHMSNEKLLTATSDNIETTWHHAINVKAISNLAAITDNGIGHHLDPKNDHVIGYDVIRNDGKDSIIRLDYIKQVPVTDINRPEKKEIYEHHNDLVLASNHDVDVLHNHVWLDDIPESVMPDRNPPVTNVEKENNHIHDVERLRHVINEGK